MIGVWLRNIVLRNQGNTVCLEITQRHRDGILCDIESKRDNYVGSPTKPTPHA